MKRKIKKINPFAKVLRDPESPFKKKIIRNKKKYSRKIKHKKGREDD